MARLCKVTIMGNVGGDPEQRYTQTGTPVATFSVATDHGRKDPNGEGWLDQTEWFRVTCFGRLADTVMERITRGQPVYVEGRFQIDRYERDGEQRVAYNVIASDLQLLHRAPLREGQQPEMQPRRPAAAGAGRRPPVDDGELPF